MSQTRRIRRPALTLVATTTSAETDNSRRIMHDARGTAVWVGESASLDDLSALTLVVEPSAPPAIEGDPYNRPASAFGSRATPVLKAPPVKRRR